MHSQHSHAKRCTGFCTNISAPRLLIHGGTLLFQVVVLVQKSDEILRYFIPSEKDECWRRKLKEGGGRRADGDGRCCRYCRSRLSLVDRCGPGTDPIPPTPSFSELCCYVFTDLERTDDTASHGRSPENVGGDSCRRLRQWLCVKHKERAGGNTRFPQKALHQKFGLVRLTARTASFPWANA